MKRPQTVALFSAFIFTLLASVSLHAQVNELKKAVFTFVDENESMLGEVSDSIWEFAEIELTEKRSAELLAKHLENAGFTVERGVAGLETAFVARWGSGSPVIGILAEYDALPGLSQRRGESEKTPHQAGAAGHGCGHNLFGAACLGAALSLRQVMEEHALPGTLVIFGCPAEETVVGKVIMAKAGLFDDLDAAITWHPSQRTGVTLSTSLALNNFEVSFRGRTAHGAADPWNGRSALDALELFHFGINLMREHVKPTVRIHYVVKDGGAAPNVVPDFARGWYFTRDVTRDGVRDIYSRIMKIAEGAAMATETSVSVELITGVHAELVNMAIARRHYENLKMVGAPQFTGEEQEFAKAIQRYLGIAETGLSNEIRPFEPYKGGRGSTDVAEVSRIVPLAEFNVAMAPMDGPWHSWVVVSCGGTSLGKKAMLVAAKTLAATALDLLTDSELLEEAKAEFEKNTAGHPYVSPLDEDSTQ